MTVFRSAGRRPPAPQLPEEMPPRPARQPYRDLGADTMPRLAFGPGPVNPDWDPCGRPHPPLKTASDEGEAA